MNKNLKSILMIGLALVCTGAVQAQNAPRRARAARETIDPSRIANTNVEYDQYFTEIKADAAPVSPDEKGFIRRWTILEPISKPNGGNSGFTDSYVRAELSKVYYKDQYTTELKKLPKTGSKVKVESETPRPTGRGFGMQQQPAQQLPATTKQTLAWHSVDSKLFNVKLFRFATNLSELHYGVIFHAYTVVNCEEDMTVRLAAGSNSASVWYVNGEEVLLLQSDRRMVADDGMSKRITLKKGKNIVHAAVINGPGMSDMCMRFVDENGTPVKNITITCK